MLLVFVLTDVVYNKIKTNCFQKQALPTKKVY